VFLVRGAGSAFSSALEKIFHSFRSGLAEAHRWRSARQDTLPTSFLRRTGHWPSTSAAQSSRQPRTGFRCSSRNRDPGHVAGYSPYTAIEMQCAQVLADSIRACIQSGQNINDQAAAPLKAGTSPVAVAPVSQDVRPPLPFDPSASKFRRPAKQGPLRARDACLPQPRSNKIPPIARGVPRKAGPVKSPDPGTACRGPSLWSVLRSLILAL
jgi:hypothetical protein